MRIVGQRLLAHYSTKNAASKAAISAWSALVARATWARLSDAQSLFGSRISHVSGNRLAFALLGDELRLESEVAYDAGLVLVTAIGTVDINHSFKPAVPAQAASEAYNAYISHVSAAMQKPIIADSPAAEQFSEVVAKLATYEKRQWPIGHVDPTAFLTCAMAMTSRTQNDLGRVLGSKEKAIEIMNRKRHLSMSQAHTIAAEWNLPAKLLTGA